MVRKTVHNEVHVAERKTHEHNVKNWLKDHFNPSKRFPFINTIRNYNLKKLKGDLIAGISVGLLLIPQSIAIASIYSSPLINGMYSSLFGPVTSFFLSTSQDNSVGPTVLVGIVTSRYNIYGLSEYLSLMSFFCGLVVILLSILNAGIIMNFVSFVVLSAFMTCGSLTILISQLPSLFGIVIKDSGKMNSYYLLYQFFKNIKFLKWPDLVMGLVCIIICLIMHYCMPSVINRKQKSKNKCLKVTWTTTWLLFIGKNIVLTIIMSIIAFIVVSSYNNTKILTLTGYLPPGFPKPWIPIQSAINPITNEVIPVQQIISETYQSFFIIPIMMFIETLVVVINYSKQKNYEIDCTQELFNIGMSNIINSFFRGFPIGGAMSRAAVNAVSGVSSTISGLFVFIILSISLSFLTPYLYYIPKAALAGLIISAVIPSINFNILKTIYNTQRWDFLPWFATFFIGLYALEYGIGAGMALSAGFILFRNMRPRIHRIHHTNSKSACSFCFRLRTSLYFPGAEFIVDKIKSFKKYRPELSEIFIDCHAMLEIDITVARELYQTVLFMKNNQNVDVKFIYVRDGRTKLTFHAAGLTPYIVVHESVVSNECRHCHRYHQHCSKDHQSDENNYESIVSAPIKISSKKNINQNNRVLTGIDENAEVFISFPTGNVEGEKSPHTALLKNEIMISAELTIDDGHISSSSTTSDSSSVSSSERNIK